MIEGSNFWRKREFFKVVEFGLEKEVLNLYYNVNMGFEAIRVRLREQGFDISAQAVKNFIEWFSTKMPEMISAMKQEQLAEYAEMTMSTLRLLVQQIGDVEKEIEELKKRKENGEKYDWRQLAELRRTLLKLTELIAKFRGELKTGTTITKIDNRQLNVKQLNMQIKNSLIKQLEEKGEIKEIDGKEVIVIKDWAEALYALKKKNKAIEVKEVGAA